MQLCMRRVLRSGRVASPLGAAACSVVLTLFVPWCVLLYADGVRNAGFTASRPQAGAPR